MRWLVLLPIVCVLHADTLYYTDFENFNVGDNNWSGTDGWLSNDTSSGAQAIESNLFPAIALGKSATLGFTQPNISSTPPLLVSVLKPFNYDHTATGLDGIEISCFLAIADSTEDTNFRRDDFFLTIYNAVGEQLAAIRFDNEDPAAADSEFGIWREDGVSAFDTLVQFNHGDLFDLFIQIDLASNTWSADIGGLPLFTDATFTASGHAVNFGLLAFEWSLSANFPFAYGDNFIAVDELTVRSFPIGVEPFIAEATTDPDTGHVTVTWPGEVGFDYQVEYSTNLENWLDTLPGSTFPSVTTAGELSYTDIAPPTNSPAFYRVVRAESP